MRRQTPSRVRHTYCALVALRWLPVGLIVPLMVLVMTERGLSLADVGLVFSTYFLTVALLELPTGGLADALGRRPVLVLGTGCNLAYLGLLLVAQDVATFALASVLHGAERALRSGPLEAWFVDTSRALDPEVDLRRGLTAGAIADGAAVGVGALAAGLLPQLAPGLPEAGAAVLSRITLPILLALLMEVLHLCAVLALVSDLRPATPRSDLRGALAGVPRTVRAALGLVRAQPSIRLLLLGVGVAGLAMSAVEALWQPRFADLVGGVTGNTVAFGLLSATGFLSAAVGSALAPLVARRVGGGAARAATWIVGLHAVALVALAAAGSALPLAAAYLGVYIATGARFPLHNELLHERVPAEQRATMLSVNSLALMVGGLVASLTLPRLADAAGIPVAWLVAAGLLAASGLCYARIRPPVHEAGRMGGVVDATR